MIRSECVVCRENFSAWSGTDVPQQAIDIMFRLMTFECTGSLPSTNVRIDGKLQAFSPCDWQGHQSAVEEAGFCPVCQH